MLEAKILLIRNISVYWVWAIILIYGLILGEYVYIFNSKIQVLSGNLNVSYFTLFNNVNFIFTVILSLVAWLVIAMVLHCFSILVGGDSTYKSFLKGSSICYIIPTICHATALIIFDNLAIPSSDVPSFLASNKAMIFSNKLVVAGYSCYYLMHLLVIKYFYQINWLKAFGAVAIPIGSIYLLGQFFGNYVL
jgi:hypothetical protein